MQTAEEIAPLRTEMRKLLDRECSFERVRALAASGERHDAGLWRLASELGWHALGIPELHDGLGMGFQALAAAYEELGRTLAPLPFLPAQLCAEALLVAGSETQRARYLPKIAAGTLCASLMSPDTLSNPQQAPTLRIDGDVLRLDGAAHPLLCPLGADLLLAFAYDRQHGWAAVLIEPAGDGVEIQPQPTMDETRHLGSIRLSELLLPAERRLPGDALVLCDALMRHAALALALDSIGGADRILARTIDYLKVRKQFGRAVGSFQALKHRAANLKLALESSRCLVNDAVQRHVSGHPDAALWASLAKFQAADAYAFIAGDCVQLHGGIGFTWDHECHLFLKRAKLNQMLFGSSAWHQDRAASLLTRAA